MIVFNSNQSEDVDEFKKMGKATKKKILAANNKTEL